VTDVLLTGATGLVGGELVARLLASRPEATIHCLLRARGGELEARRREVVEWARLAPAEAERVVAIAGDVRRPDLGLGDALDPLAERVDEVFHTAADTNLSRPVARARAINVRGAENVAAFAKRALERGGLRRLHHVSTAYVAGKGAEADGRPVFHNGYEQSKWEAEQHLASLRDELPITVYRPSIIVGDSRDGRTKHFRVLYDPIKWVYRGGARVLPCRTEARVDVVPINYVCDALIALSAQPKSEGGTFHLTSGPAHSIQIAEFAELVVLHGHAWQRAHGEEPTEPPALLPPEQIEALAAENPEQARQLLDLFEKVMSAHMPYMVTEILFDDPETRSALAGTGIECPSLREYVDRLIDYAGEVNWGDPR